MWVVGKGSDDVFRIMLSLKLDIDINMVDKYGGIVLYVVVFFGYVSIVKLLLENNV